MTDHATLSPARLREIVERLRRLARDVGTVLDVAARRSDPDADHRAMLVRLKQWRDELFAIEGAASECAVREAQLRTLAKDLLFAVDVTEPEPVLLGRFIDILRRAVPAAGEGTDAQGWQPMDTAPKDGKAIYVVARATTAVPLETMWAYWNQRLSWWYRFAASEPTRIYPTLWMPLPKVPEVHP